MTDRSWSPTAMSVLVAMAMGLAAGACSSGPDDPLAGGASPPSASRAGDDPAGPSRPNPVDAAAEVGGIEPAARQATTLTVFEADAHGDERPPPSTASGGSPASRRWAVVLAGATNPQDPILVDVMTELAEFGHRADPTNCDRGASEAIGMPADGTFTISVYFESEDAARTGQAELSSDGFDGEVVLVDAVCPD